MVHGGSVASSVYRLLLIGGMGWLWRGVRQLLDTKVERSLYTWIRPGQYNCESVPLKSPTTVVVSQTNNY